ncbi:hypothetical protein E2562_027576, partial [Oryza meyeriana var. granulata]
MDDAGEMYAFGGRWSLRREGSAWSSAAGSVFSRSSSTREDDEEDLRWAALEKLPTYERARTALLAMPEGELREVNVQQLAAQEQRALLQRVAGVGDDHARFLSKFKERVDRTRPEPMPASYPTTVRQQQTLFHLSRVGIKLPTIEVRDMVTITTKQGLANALHITPKKQQKISILHNVSGIIKPHRMTLLLGPPGSGKTSLLMALAGTLPSTVKAATTGKHKEEVVTDHILK